jgi:signal transduction protein with GAF and PtsI domain
VPGIGEERFPAFLAVPVLRADTTEAVLVLQRREAKPFGASEHALAAALAAPFALALATGKPPDDAAGVFARPRGHRAARLDGELVVEGSAVGVARAAPTFGGLVSRDVNASAAEIRRVFAELSHQLLRAARSLVGLGVDVASGSIETVLHDERLIAVAVDECREQGVARGLREVARSYALTPYRLGLGGGVDWLAARAREVEQLCLLAAAELVGVEALEAGSVLLLPEAPGTLLALAARAHGVAGIAVGDELDPDDPAVEILWRADIPTLAEVAGLFEWVRDGDRVLIDGSTGCLRTDPAPGELVRLRLG